ncbi:MAG: 16S rRNA (guanine(966)-N(2))-methyltransferase RsmD [Pseudomonadota bacterium]
MRIIGGRFRGQFINAPAGFTARPTTDRVRENIFNILQSRLEFDGLRVLDLFAGSGALGFEAISRGAGYCLFIEQSKKVLPVLHQSIQKFSLDDEVDVLGIDCRQLGAIGETNPFDLVFADPPYSKGLGERAASMVAKDGWLAPGALLVLEEDKGSLPDEITHFDMIDRRFYGQTGIGLFKFEGSDPK